MAEKKRKPAAKHKKKTTVEKHKVHTSVKKKTLVEEVPQKQEVQEEAASQPQAPVVPSETTTHTESTNPLGTPVVASSGVLPEAPKEQESPPEPQSPETSQLQPQSKSLQPQEQQPQIELSGQTADSLQSQPKAVSSTPDTETSQGSLSSSGVVRDKEEQEVKQQDIDESKKRPAWIVIAIVVIVLVLIGGGLWYFRESVIKKASIQGDIIPAPSVLKNTPTPATDSAKLEIDYSKYKIKVLNGSSIRGVAAKGKEILESEKFIVEEIGNAEV